MFHSFSSDLRIDQSMREDFTCFNKQNREKEWNREREKNSRYRVEVDKILSAENKGESEQTLTGFVEI